MSGFVYFVADEHARFKIGFSLDPAARLKELQTGNGGTLRLLGTLPGNQSLERAMHDRFSRWRLQGEWFGATASALAEIDAVLAEPIVALTRSVRSARRQVKGFDLAKRVCEYFNARYPIKAAANVAEDLGVSEKTVRKWFEGVATPSGEYLHQMIAVYGVSFYAFIMEKPHYPIRSAARLERQEAIISQISGLFAEYEKLRAEELADPDRSPETP